MIFRFAANLELAEVWDGKLVAAYLCGTLAVYLIATAVARIRAPARASTVPPRPAAGGDDSSDAWPLPPAPTDAATARENSSWARALASVTTIWQRDRARPSLSPLICVISAIGS